MVSRTASGPGPAPDPGPAQFSVARPAVLFVGACPTLGELRFVEPQIPLSEFLDFRSCVHAGGFFNLAYPLQTLRDLRDPGLFSRDLLLPLLARILAGGPARRSLLQALQLRLL